MKSLTRKEPLWVSNLVWPQGAPSSFCSGGGSFPWKPVSINAKGKEKRVFKRKTRAIIKINQQLCKCAGGWSPVTPAEGAGGDVLTQGWDLQDLQELQDLQDLQDLQSPPDFVTPPFLLIPLMPQRILDFPAWLHMERRLGHRERQHIHDPKHHLHVLPCWRVWGT